MSNRRALARIASTKVGNATDGPGHALPPSNPKQLRFDPSTRQAPSSVDPTAGGTPCSFPCLPDPHKSAQPPSFSKAPASRTFFAPLGPSCATRRSSSLTSRRSPCTRLPHPWAIVSTPASSSSSPPNHRPEMATSHRPNWLQHSASCSTYSPPHLRSA